MPQKPSKSSLKFWLLCEVKTFYVLKAIPYLGKEDHPDDVGEAEHVVMTLMKSHLKTDLNVTSDNFFTSLKTARKRFQNNITMVGTVLNNKKEIPSWLHDARKLPLLLKRFVFTEDEGTV